MQVESVLNPVRGIRDAQARAGITPTDHSRHNILAIKEQSRLNALQKLQQQDDGQQPQVKPQLRRTTSGSGTGSGGSSRAVSRTTSVGAARQPSRGSDGSSGGGSRNFLAENRATAGAASRPIKGSSKSDDGAAFLQKSNYGQVPSYLLERRMQMAQEQEALQAAKVAAQIPPGEPAASQHKASLAVALLSCHTSDSSMLCVASGCTVHQSRRHKTQ